MLTDFLFQIQAEVIASRNKEPTNEPVDHIWKETKSFERNDIAVDCGNDESREKSDSSMTVVYSPEDEGGEGDAASSSETAKSDTDQFSDDVDTYCENMQHAEPESEEESCVRMNVCDALGVDWANFCAKSNAFSHKKPDDIQTSAKERWQPHRILLDVGVSFKMAGAKFATRTILDAQQKLASALVPPSLPVESVDSKKIHIKMEKNVESSHDIEFKSEKMMPEPNNNTTESSKLHSVAAAQVMDRVAYESLVFHAAGPYSRVVNARRDVAMRRQLCNLSVNEKNSKPMGYSYASRYEDMAIKLFQRAFASNKQ